MDAQFLAACSTRSNLLPPTLPEVAVAGRSNCGKSSLINAICGRKKLARTSSTPGRTRQIIFFSLAGHGGPPIHLVDLPGYGFARVSRVMKDQWGTLISEYIETRPTLRAMLLLMDIRRRPGSEEQDLVRWLGQREIRPLLVLTKADKLNRSQRLLASRRLGRELGLEPLVFSTKQPEAVTRLRRIMAELGQEFTPSP